MSALELQKISTYADHVHCLNGKAHFLENFINMFVKHRPTVLCGQYKMVQKYRYIVTLMNVIAHLYNYTASGGEFNPKRLNTAKT